MGTNPDTWVLMDAVPIRNPKPLDVLFHTELACFQRMIRLETVRQHSQTVFERTTTALSHGVNRVLRSLFGPQRKIEWQQSVLKNYLYCAAKLPMSLFYKDINA